MASRSSRPALSLSLAVIAAIVAVVAASGWFAGSGSQRRQVADSGHSVVTLAPPSAARSAAGAASTSRVPGTARPAAPVLVTVDSPQGTRILSAPVDRFTASRNSDGTWAPVKPPTRSRAVWLTQSAAPAAPSGGTTAIYGHACIGIACVFDNAVRTTPGSTVILQTDRTVLRYRVSSIQQYPKVGALSLSSRPNHANELILVTCAYRSDQTSIDNLVITATLLDARHS